MQITHPVRIIAAAALCANLLAGCRNEAPAAPVAASIPASVAPPAATPVPAPTPAPAPAPEPAPSPEPETPPPPPPLVPPAAGVKADITPTVLTLSNGLIERRWTRAPFLTERYTDLRNGRVWSERSADFVLNIGGREIASDAFDVIGEPQVAATAKGSLRMTLDLAPAALSALPLGLRVTRVVEIFPGVAGLRQETSIGSPLPLALGGYSLDQVLPKDAAQAQMHAFRAGADWREPEWAGPPLSLGDAQTGDWRKTTSGDAVSGTAQWLSVADAQDRRLFMVLERNDQASSTMSYAGGRARAGVDFSRDVIYLGPLEEQGHVGNPLPGPGRVRTLLPGAPLQLEPVFTGFAQNGDDEAWQHYKYLANFRMPPYRREVTFNSNGTDDNKISTGAKDDLDFATFQQVLDTAARMGIETFIFDDGWQARSGDWCPDSVSNDPACQDPRRGSATGYPPRFPDSSFTAVQALLKPLGMNLGLWMSPMHFHPSATAFQDNPQWACLPLSAGLIALNSQNYSGSNEAGIAQWNPQALAPDGSKFIDYLESRIRRAIDAWGVRYFKFDFTVWADCVGLYPTDMYTYRESFMGMLDRILHDHPDVTIQMDETNDYRLWPFEALARGPTWYQNGSPTPAEALHANWVLAPFVPLYALGRNALRTDDLKNFPVDYQMAVALLSHMTFFNELRRLPANVVPAIRRWTDYYKGHRADLAQLAYPLLSDDPINANTWAAFQTWNPESGNGALLVYRQDATAAMRTIPLRNVPEGRYRLLEAPLETSAVEYTAQQLRSGIDIVIPVQRSARVFRIERIANE